MTKDDRNAHLAAAAIALAGVIAPDPAALGLILAGLHLLAAALCRR